MINLNANFQFSLNSSSYFSTFSTLQYSSVIMTKVNLIKNIVFWYFHPFSGLDLDALGVTGKPGPLIGLINSGPPLLAYLLGKHMALFI